MKQLKKGTTGAEKIYKIMRITDMNNKKTAKQVTTLDFYVTIIRKTHWKY